MAYSVDWITKVITIPRADMTPLGGFDYELSADAFWRELRRLEWTYGEGLGWPDILGHLNERTLAGSDYVPENRIINGYTILMDGPAPVAQKVFLRGDNNDIIDVLIFNGVSVIPSNSAGNTIARVEVPVLSQEQADDLKMIKAGVVGRTELEDQPDGTQDVVIYGDDGVTVLRRLNLSVDRKSRIVVT